MWDVWLFIGLLKRAIHFYQNVFWYFKLEYSDTYTKNCSSTDNSLYFIKSEQKIDLIELYKNNYVHVYAIKKWRITKPKILDCKKQITWFTANSKFLLDLSTEFRSELKFF